MSSTETHVCIDTNIAIWALKSQVPPERPADVLKILRARKLMADLSEQAAKISFPSIVLAELLVRGAGTSAGAELERKITQHFPVLPFDANCAVRHAELIKKWLPQSEREKIQEGDVPYTKAMLRADILIVSTMLGHNIPVLYTDENEKLPKIARAAGITVRDLPAFEESLF